MSEPLKLICRTCNDHCYTESGMQDKQLQEWYEIRHELAVVRTRWLSWATEPPRISRDDDECTGFLCKHKDHDLCLGDMYGKKIREFDKSKDKPINPGVKRYFRELRSGPMSDIMEIDEAPRLHYSIVKPKKMVGVLGCGELGSVTPPFNSIRYVWKRDEVVLLRVYKEE